MHQLGSYASSYLNMGENSVEICGKMNQAYEIVKARQKVVFERTKKRCDSRFKTASFEVGELVISHQGWPLTEEKNFRN